MAELEAVSSSLALVPLQLYGVAKFRPMIVSQTRTVRELNARFRPSSWSRCRRSSS